MFWFSKFQAFVTEDKRTDLEKILDYMKPDRQYLISDLARICGYETGTRVWDLCRKGLVKRVGTKKGWKHQLFALYSLNQ